VDHSSRILVPIFIAAVQLLSVEYGPYQARKVTSVRINSFSLSRANSPSVTIVYNRFTQ